MRQQILAFPRNPRAFASGELVVDNFAGGGGASLGIEWALGRQVDVAVNHDREAIAMHMANHPGTQHYCEDVWNVDPVEATDGRPVGLAWFSPDCTFHSKARGGKPFRDRSKAKRRRGLAWVVIKWAKVVRPRIIMLENVEEFQYWGPLRDDGLPCPVRKGKTFGRWKAQLENLGYRVECRELRACDFGAPTIRKRLFVVARCDGQPIVWPTPTHGNGLAPYRTAAECIDWSASCPSIFGRERPLAEATMRRIAKGVFRYVLNTGDPFIVTCNHAGDGFRGQGSCEPMKTITAARDAHGIVVPYLAGNGSKQAGLRIEEVAETAAKDRTRHADLPSGADQLDDKDPARGPAPMPNIEDADGVKQRCSMVSAFLAQHNGGMVGHDIRVPVSTIVGSGSQQQLVAAHVINMKGSDRRMGPASAPAPTVTAGGFHVGEVRAFLLKYYGTDQDPQLRMPLHTVTTKDRFGIVTVKGEDYVIADIGMRMLQPRELYRAQGFPDTYTIAPVVNGKLLSKTAQVRMCGNSVSPAVAKALVQANVIQSVLPVFEHAISL